MTRADELLAAIYAAPDDDAPRLVYADHLLDRGEPRGELIALQLRKAHGMLTQEQHARERELIALHARAWLAPLPIRIAGVRFERGFVAVCETTGGFLDDQPAWATVREVNSVPATDACHTHSLRVVHVADGGVVRLAQLARPLPIEELVWNGPTYWHAGRWVHATEAIRAWSEIRVLPRLRTVRLLGSAAWCEPTHGLEPRHLAWLWGSRYLPALVDLTLPITPARLPEWLAAASPSRLSRLELRTRAEESRAHAWRAIFERDPRGALTTLTLRAPSVPPTLPASQAADQLVTGLHSLPAVLRRARVIVPGATWHAYATARAGIAAALARQPADVAFEQTVS